MGILTVIMIVALNSVRWYTSDAQSPLFNVVTFGAVGDGKADDSQAFTKAWAAACGAAGNPTLLIPGGKTFLLKPIRFTGKCKGTGLHVQVLGNIVAPSDPRVMGPASVWIEFFLVDGLTIDGSGLIDGRGSSWWNKVPIRPTALSIQSCNHFTMAGVHMSNSPRNHIAINACTNVLINGISISTPGNTPNTDGINIGGSNGVIVQNSNIACGDDCISILNNTFNVNINNIACGPGHGISIGSLGDNKSFASVSNINVSHCTFTKTMNGARIKTYQGGSGSATGIHFQHLHFDAVDNPIIIDQYYMSKPNMSSAVAISDVEFNDIRGTGSMELVIKLACSESVPCKGVRLLGVNLTSAAPGKMATSYCLNAQGSSSGCSPPVPCLSH